MLQTSDKTYLTHGYDNDGKGYNVCEIIVHSDSSYTFKSYKVSKRNERKHYKKVKPEVSYGKIEKDGEFYKHTEYKNETKTNSYWFSKFAKDKIIIYGEDKNGKLVKLNVYKRIDE
jgi:hypothetical protein